MAGPPHGGPFLSAVGCVLTASVTCSPPSDSCVVHDLATVASQVDAVLGDVVHVNPVVRHPVGFLEVPVFRGSLVC